jgi:hypothetical protein
LDVYSIALLYEIRRGKKEKKEKKEKERCPIPAAFLVAISCSGLPSSLPFTRTPGIHVTEPMLQVGDHHPTAA